MGMRALLAAPALLLLVLFALSNTKSMHLGLWPTDLVLEAPASVVILCAMGVAFLAGGALVWMNEISGRRRTRRAEDMVKLLEEQVRELKARLPVAPLLPPPGS